METMEATKRQFRKIFTIKMETEVPEDKLWEIRKVEHVRVKFYDEQDNFVDEFVEPPYPPTP